MQTRALVNDPEASAEARLARSVSALEGFYRHDTVFRALDRLWLWWVWALLRRDLDHLLWYVGRPRKFDAPSTDAAWKALRHNQEKLRAQVSTLRHDASLSDAVVATIEPLGRGTAPWAWVRTTLCTLDDRNALGRWRQAHADACRRANRHRNLVTHDSSIGEAVAVQSADFIARELELAVWTRSDDAAVSVLHGFDSDPDASWIGRPPIELLNAVASAQC